MKKQINDLLLKMQTGENCIGETANRLLDLFAVMHRSFQGTNGYAIEHLINETYQVVDKIDGTVHYQGTKRDCEFYLNGA